MPPAPLFFDLDGTLLDTVDDVTADMMATLRELGLDAERYRRRFRFGPPLREALFEVYPEMNNDLLEEFVRRFRERYNTSDYPLTRPYPGIDELLHRAAGAGCPLFIVTFKRQIPTARLIKKFGWTDLFAEIFTVDRFAPDIPVMLKPEMIARSGVDTRGARLIGDAPTDLDAAHEAHLAAAAVTWGYSTEEELLARLGPGDKIVRRIEELTAILLG
ncbi:MAG: HAD family hydrolase [Thermoguttaceae bacterium]|nr:HAD family hydrolase [Thermoguttaceae bacterium]